MNRTFLSSLFAVLAFCAVTQHAPAQQADPVSAAIAAGDWSRAEVLARSRTVADRRDPAAWTYLGLAEDHLGKHREALGSFLEASRLAPRATFAANNLGGAYEAAGQPDRAIVQYRRSLALDRAQPAAMVNLARLLSAGDHAAQVEAHALLESAWALAPDAEVARSLLLLAPCAAGEAPAPAPVGDVRVYVSPVAASWQQISEPDRPAVAHALLACGYGAEAIDLYGRMLQSQPANVDAALGLAQAQLAAGQAPAAGLTLEREVAGGVESAPVYALLASAYQATGHADHAVDAMKRALELAPQDRNLRFRYCMLLLDTNAPRAAELRSREAVQMFPDAARLWFVLGLAQFDQNDPAAAQPSFDRAIALDPHFAPAVAYRGLCALDQQRYAEAETWYRQAIKTDQKAADLHSLLAEALERQHPDQTGPIRQELDRALALDPGLAVSYLTLCRIDLQDQRIGDAVNAAQRALQLDPSLRQAHFYLARAYRQLHQPEKAEAESRIFGVEKTSAEAAEHAAYLARVRQLSNTTF